MYQSVFSKNKDILINFELTLTNNLGEKCRTTMVVGLTWHTS